MGNSVGLLQGWRRVVSLSSAGLILLLKVDGASQVTIMFPLDYHPRIPSYRNIRGYLLQHTQVYVAV